MEARKIFEREKDIHSAWNNILSAYAVEHVHMLNDGMFSLAKCERWDIHERWERHFKEIEEADKACTPKAKKYVEVKPIRVIDADIIKSAKTAKTSIAKRSCKRKIPKEGKTLLQVFIPDTLARMDYSVGKYGKYKKYNEYYGNVSKNVRPNDGYYPNVYDAPLTSYAQAVIYDMSIRFVYSNLRNVYQKSGYPFTYELMNECIHYASTESKELASYLANQFIRERIDADSDWKSERAYIPVKHEYTVKCELIKCKRVRTRVSIKKHVENKLTAYGRALEKLDVVCKDCNVVDLIQEARLAMVTLVRFGLCNKPSDFYDYTGYINKGINQYVESMKNAVNRLEQCEYVDENGDLQVVSIADVDKEIQKVDRTSAIKAIREIIASKLDKRIARDNVLYCFDTVYCCGVSKTSVADVLNVDEKQIRRWCSAIDTILKSKDLRKLYIEILTA